PPVACSLPGKVEQFGANAMEVEEWAGGGEKRRAGVLGIHAAGTALQTGERQCVTRLGSGDWGSPG
nr:hypothetical protein [Tanacetum cinerariifolium]